MPESNSIKRWRSVKSKTPIIGIDDGGFDIFALEQSTIPVFGVIMKGSAYVDGVIQCSIERDDPEATSKLIKLISSSVHLPQLQGIFLQGITIGGFGVIDIWDLYQVTKVPVIVVLKKYPHYDSIKKALLENFDDGTIRWEIIKRAGEPIKVQDRPVLYLQVAGIHPEDAYLLTQKCTTVGTIPEALRIAHFIGASYFRFQNDH
ncbi:MAG: endonuclease dU [Candidatus Hodarchaeales archaeon]